MKNSTTIDDVEKLIQEIRSKKNKKFPKGIEPLAEGQTYPITIICLDVVGHSKWMKRHPEKEARSVLRSFRDLVKESINEYHGEIWHWAGDGAIAAFWGERRRERGVFASIKILHNLGLFNLDASQNHLRDPIQIRIAGNDGRIEFCKSAGEISSETINDTSKLESLRTRSGEFNIYDSLYYSFDPKLQAVFTKIDEGFMGKAVFTYSGHRRQDKLTDVAIDEIITNSIQIVTEVETICQGVVSGAIDKRVVREVYEKSKIFYDGLSSFYRSFFQIDSQWSNKYKKSLLARTSQFLDLEGQLWTRLKNLLQQVGSTQGAAEEFRLLRSFIINTHTKQELELSNLKGRLLEALGRNTNTDDSQDLIANFIRSDEIEAIPAFASLMNKVSTSDLIAQLSNEPQTTPDSERLFSKLWALADLVLIEDHEAQRPDDEKALKLLGYLQNRPGQGTHFRVLQHFLEDNAPIKDLFIHKFRSEGIEPKLIDLDVLWRSIILCHQNINYRFQAASLAPTTAIWQLITYHKTSLPSLWVTTQRVKEREETGIKKIFFDCIRPRLIDRINKMPDEPESVNIIQEIIDLLFSFDLFVETPYFRDLEALLALYRAQLSRLGVDGPLFKSEIDAIRNQRVRKKKNSREIPDSVSTVPPAVQRHLARHGSFVEYFACHPDQRIARETKRYFNDNKRLEELVNFCLKNRMMPNKTLIQALPTPRRKNLLSKLDDSVTSSRNTALDELLRRRLSSTEIEWLKRRRQSL